MGWEKYKRNVMAGLQTMAPIEEESEECRTPTPVDGSGDQEVKQNDTVAQSGDVTPTPGSRSNSRVSGLLGSPVETSFSDHLQSLVEDYTREIINKDRQLREVRKQKHDLYIELWNYKLSWTMDRAEMDELRAQLEEERKEKERMQDEYLKFVDELNKVQERLDALTENGQTRSRSTSSRSSVEEEERQPRVPAAPQPLVKRDIVPTVPQSQVKVQKRPYTGKSRDVQLPPITVNNKVVKSSVAPSRSGSRGSSVHLPPIAPSLPKLSPSPPKLTPSPPKLPRSSKSSSRSRIPWALPPLRRGS